MELELLYTIKARKHNISIEKKNASHFEFSCNQ